MSMRSMSLAATVLMALSASSTFADSKTKYVGAVFVQTNGAQGNSILRYGRKADGSLVWLGSTPTEGRGSGGTIDPLGSQNSLLLTQDAGYLMVVNSASSTVSTFEVEGAKLELVDVVPSGGSAPNALAQWGNLVYVLNVAGNSNVTGFRLENGHLRPIKGAVGYLSAAISGGSSINFTPDGKSLIATERVTGNIDVFPVNADGTVGTPQVTKDAGLFDLTVAPNGAVLSLEPGAKTITSSVISGGALNILQVGSNPDGGACWIVVTPQGNFVYTANTVADTLSGFVLNGSGTLSLIAPTNVVATLTPGSKALDLSISSDSKYLYSINAGSGSVGIWYIGDNGALTAKPFVAIPGAAAAGFNGIAAY